MQRAIIHPSPLASFSAGAPASSLSPRGFTHGPSEEAFSIDVEDPAKPLRASRICATCLSRLSQLLRILPPPTFTAPTPTATAQRPLPPPPTAAYALLRLATPPPPHLLTLVLLVLTSLSWLHSSGRTPQPNPALYPRHIPVLAIPMSVTRGATLLSALAALDAPVDTLLLCDSAPGVPELGCVAGEVEDMVANGTLPVKRVRVVTPSGGGAPGPVYGVSECWNALARDAFQGGGEETPWMVVMNDDVGFSWGTLRRAVAAAWEGYKGKSLLLANDGLPGVGYAFSAFVLTREGYRSLGAFDENFFPAYFEVRRALCAARTRLLVHGFCLPFPSPTPEPCHCRIATTFVARTFWLHCYPGLSSPNSTCSTPSKNTCPPPPRFRTA